MRLHICKKIKDNRGSKMVREIICPEKEEYVIRIPAEYINKKLEILILPLFEEKGECLIDKTAGVLKDKNIDPAEWQRKIRSEWD